MPAPTITSITPNHGPVGTAATIIGTNLSGVTAMRIGGVATQFAIHSSTNLTFILPGGLIVGPHNIDFDYADTFTDPGAFTDTAPSAGGDAFAYITNTANPTGAVAALPAHVDVSWVFHWSNLQPTTGSSIDWSNVDACLAAATAAGKKSMIRINCGGTSPSDIPTVAITYTNAAGQTQTQQIPKLWASNYTGPLHTFIAALGARYSSDSRIKVVQMPGNGRIGELAMGTPLAGTPTWQSYGYTDALELAAWEATIAAYLSAFPTGYLAWDMSSEPFSGAHILDALITYLGTLSSRVVVQGNGLKNNAGIAKAVTQSVGHRPVGSQAWLPVSKGGATVPQLISTATGVPLNYMEIYAADCTSSVDSAIAAWKATAPSL
jgi:hypothetical protein